MAQPILLLTGASGFLGRWIAKAAIEAGVAVHGVDMVAPENAPALTSYTRLMLPNESLRDLVAHTRPTLCVHCAGRASVALSAEEPTADYQAGPGVTFHLLEILRTTAPKCRLIFISSAAVYGNPTRLPVAETESPSPLSPYGFHKWQCEILCREYAEVFNLRTLSLRIFSAYGPGLRRQVLWDICRKIISGEPLALRGTGVESRDFIHTMDMAAAVMLVASRGNFTGEVYNLASGEEVSIRDLAVGISTHLGSNISPVFDGQRAVGDPLNWRADVSKLRDLGFLTRVALADGVKSYAHWAAAELRGV